MGRTTASRNRPSRRRFQSLGRDSVGWDPQRSGVPPAVGVFQSLGRDSVGWDQSPQARGIVKVGGFQSLGRDSVGWDSGRAWASSPQPGFQSLGRDSVGWDAGPPPAREPSQEFQSLGRDSVGWDPLQRGRIMHGGASFQSLGRDSVGWDKISTLSNLHCNGFQSLGRDSVGWDALALGRFVSACPVSIPRSGFCGVGQQGAGCVIGQVGSFNPSVGILWGGTRLLGLLLFGQGVSIPRSGFCGVGLHSVQSGPAQRGRFQSLGRDSVGWDYHSPICSPCAPMVSIPRSGFCGVGRLSCSSAIRRAIGFNPSVGILWGGTNGRGKARGRKERFQSLGRDSVGWD